MLFTHLRGTRADSQLLFLCTSFSQNKRFYVSLKGPLSPPASSVYSSETAPLPSATPSPSPTSISLKTNQPLPRSSLNLSPLYQIMLGRTKFTLPPKNHCSHFYHMDHRVFHLPRLSPILLLKILKLSLTLRLTEMKKKMVSSIFELAKDN